MKEIKTWFFSFSFDRLSCVKLTSVYIRYLQYLRYDFFFFLENKTPTEGLTCRFIVEGMKELPDIKDPTMESVSIYQVEKLK